MQYFGDSYDLVKRFLLECLAPDEPWVALPMYTHEVAPWLTRELELFLGVGVLAPEPLAADTDRAGYFSVPDRHLHVFVDPDTGIKLRGCGGQSGTRYVFGDELVDLCLSQPKRLVLVFDQSLVRGRERESLDAKLEHFYGLGVHSFAYYSHACFVVLSADRAVLDAAMDHLTDAHLPSTRIVSGPCA